MKSRLMAAVVGASMLAATPVFTQSAAAQPAPAGSSGGYMVPMVVGAAIGATVGALLWPVVVPAGAAMGPGAMAGAGPAMVEAAGWGWGSFMTTRAAVGAAIGAGMGYMAAR